MQRVVVVGAVRGCARQLEEVLDLGRSFPDHRWVFLGDNLSGPDAERVLQRLRGLDAIVLRGRQERTLLSAWGSAVTLADRRRWLDATGLSAASVEWLEEQSSEPSEVDTSAFPLSDLETGCGRGGPLTAVALPERVFFQSSPSPNLRQTSPLPGVVLADEEWEEL